MDARGGIKLRPQWHTYNAVLRVRSENPCCIGFLGEKGLG